MLTLDELINLKERVENGATSIEDAKNLCWGDNKEGKRSWHTNDWKDRRSKTLKSHCEICQSDDSLVIQHLSHPRKYTEIHTEIAKGYTKVNLDSMPEIDIIEFTTYLSDEYDYQPVSLCPNCNARKPNKRIRKKPQFLCTDCGSEFEQTTNRSLSDMVSNLYQNEEAPEIRDKCFTTKDEWRNKHSLLDVRYWLQRKNIEEVYDGTIQRKAFLLYLDDNIKYLSFVDTITACKKCASYYDLNRMELCPICRKNYKGIEYQSCVPCLPEEKRKMAEEKIEFGRAMREFDENLGID
jgi:hypothetical protein